MKNVELFTIGYAGKTIDEFIYCLKKSNINALVDVRSFPKSNSFPEYNSNNLQKVLRENGIKYLPFSLEFGARREEENVYSITYSLDGKKQEQVDFIKVYNSNNFQIGVKRIREGIDKGYTICFMCSESQPTSCHRLWMVAFYFGFYDDKFINDYSPIIYSIIDKDNVENFTLKYLGFESWPYRLKYETIKESFYKEHIELNVNSLIELDVEEWVTWWDNFFKSNIEHKYQRFANYLIGYIKGGKESD